MSDEIVATDVGLVRALLAEQHGDLAGFTIEPVASGWDNDTYRIRVPDGVDLVARLPRRDAAAGLLANEQRWLATFAPDLPLPIPAPLRVGVPGCDYPYDWSICPWFDGEIAADAVLANPAAEATALGEFLAALHQPAPVDLDGNPARGVGLDVRAPILDRNLEVLAETGGLAGVAAPEAVAATFASLATAPAYAGPPLRLHGDLHSANVLVNNGRIAAIIDWGDVCAGDPACDLAIAWMLFAHSERESLRVAVGCDDSTWRRAAGWALAFGAVYLANEGLSATMASVGRTLIPTVIGEFGS